MGAGINSDHLDALVRSWDNLLRTFPQYKRDYLRRMGLYMLQQVKSELGGETIQNWQQTYVGQRGGYVAVRAKPNTYKETRGAKRYAAGYVTHAVEGGHKVRAPSTRGAKGYRSRSKMAAVPGRWFYRTVKQRLGHLSESEIQALLDMIRMGLEGNL